MNPQDYLLNIPNPQQDIMSGITNAMNLKAMMEQRQMSQQQHEQSMQTGALRQEALQYNMQRQREADIAAKQAAEQARLRAEKMNMALANLTNKENPQPNDFKQILIDYPELNDTIKNAYGMMDDQNKKQLKENAVTIYRSLEVGDVDGAKDYLNTQIEAAKNAGDDKKVATLTGIIKQMEVNPDAVRATIPLLAAPLMDDDQYNQAFGRTWDAESKRTDSIIKLEEFNLKKEQAKSGYIDPDKKFDSENKLRTEFLKRTDNYTQAIKNLGILESSAEDDSGAGDIALVTSFMKMLDPGSVVRETEFATARDTVGLLESLKNKSEQIQSGKFLSPEQRKSFVGLAKRYMAEAEKEQKRVKRDMSHTIKTYGLDEKNVFGLPKRLPTYEEALAQKPGLTKDQYDAWIKSKGK